jgi:hypothetical protein
MSKTKSKPSAKRKATRAARLGSSSRRLKIGDRVRIVDIPADLKDKNYDLKDIDHREMRTDELFRFCLGREFAVQGFGRYGHVELGVGEDRAVRKRFGWSHTIWVDPEFVERIRSSRGKVSGKRKAN